MNRRDLLQRTLLILGGLVAQKALPKPEPEVVYLAGAGGEHFDIPAGSVDFSKCGSFSMLLYMSDDGLWCTEIDRNDGKGWVPL